jgi:hypothetical protein
MVPGKPHRIALMAISFVQGGFMVADGIHVLISHSYISGQIGPWAILVRKMGFNEYHMGPVFIFLGALWLAGGVLNLAGMRGGAAALLLSALITLLYPLFGTLLSLAALVVLWRQRAISKAPSARGER